MEKKMRIPKPKFSRYANNALISIYGSDEIWNYMNPYFGFDPYFFGEKNDGFKIAYSASIGKADINKLNNFQEKKIKGLLNSYNFISVRDTNTANFVNKMTNQSPFITVDPTLLFTPNVLKNYINAIDEKSKKYALIYGTIFSNEEKKKILNYCKKKNIQSISIGYNNNWVDKNYIWATPTDFIKYLSRADIVFTSMFHGIVLSVKLKKQFWYSIDPIRKSKISYFIDYLNLSSRLLSKSENLTAEFDYEKIENKLFNWIKLSREYLVSTIAKSGLIKK